MSGLPEVRDAFAAVDDDTRAAAEPMPVHRVDTMELLCSPDAPPEEERAAKRQKAAA